MTGKRWRNYAILVLVVAAVLLVIGRSISESVSDFMFGFLTGLSFVLMLAAVIFLLYKSRQNKK